MGKKSLKFIGLLLFTFLSCEKSEINEPGNLVPLLVVENLDLASININGTKLHVNTYGEPDSSLIIFLHGGPGADFRNGLNARLLADDGYRVIFYDQRGAGLSERHEKGIYSIKLYLDDLSAVINHYRKSSDQKVFLFGHSWGAILAAAYINTFPEAIDGVVFAEPGGFNVELLNEYGESSRAISLLSESTNDVFYYDQFLTGSKNQQEILDYKLAIASSFSYSKGNNEGIEGPSPFWRNGSIVLQAFIEIAEELGFDFTTNLHIYPNKVLFIYGENNKSYGLDFAEREAKFFRNSDIVQIENTGHEMLYFNWNAVHPVVLDYLDSIN